MTPNELTALLDRISSGTTTHEDAVRLAQYLSDDSRWVVADPDEAAGVWLANQDAA